MLRQSDLVQPVDNTAAEAPIPQPAPDWVPERPVRLRTATGQYRAFAVCASTEQLVGGGCSGSSEVYASYPSAKNKQHTLGGKWNCSGSSSADLTAHALCVDARPPR
ncbi:hypothetical protein ACFL6C_01885 [Myxococcota bacterium]